MDDSVEVEVLLQFLWAHVELVSNLSRMCPLPFESILYVCALFDRTTVLEIVSLVMVIASCLLLIRHPECHSYIRESFRLLPGALRNLRLKVQVCEVSPSLPPIQRVSGVEWSADDTLAEVYAMQGNRAHMEDRFSMMSVPEKHLYLYGIFDGHGGETAAEYAQKKLFPAIVDRIRKPRSDIEIIQIQDTLRQEILKLDENFVKESKKSKNYSGTTCLVAVVFRDTLIVANVGDSRGVMATDNGRTVPLSFDHKPQQLKERKRIEDAGGFISFNGVWRVAGILATSRALGDYPLKDRNLVTAEPDILTFNLAQQKSAFVILASDGLWDAFDNENAVTFIRERYGSSRSPGVCKELAKRANLKGSQDNITVLLIDFAKYSLLQQAPDQVKDDR
ncbi:protein phosphatase 1L [Galendromus occidentalis]|uniref:Protein phosphatase 1L n=1 Tax=Galendromus occidentalis TaxID=34638 RepID=A0AAJ6QM46_9ACAR|nr:protein phosphatase 1L [Galendromus occidentalis]